MRLTNKRQTDSWRGLESCCLDCAKSYVFGSVAIATQHFGSFQGLSCRNPTLNPPERLPALIHMAQRWSLQFAAVLSTLMKPNVIRIFWGGIVLRKIFTNEIRAWVWLPLPHTCTLDIGSSSSALVQNAHVYVRAGGKWKPVSGSFTRCDYTLF